MKILAIIENKIPAADLYSLVREAENKGFEFGGFALTPKLYLEFVTERYASLKKGCIAFDHTRYLNSFTGSRVLAGYPVVYLDDPKP